MYGKTYECSRALPVTNREGIFILPPEELTLDFLIMNNLDIWALNETIGICIIDFGSTVVRIGNGAVSYHLDGTMDLVHPAVFNVSQWLLENTMVESDQNLISVRNFVSRGFLSLIWLSDVRHFVPTPNCDFACYGIDVAEIKSRFKQEKEKLGSLLSDQEDS